MGAFARWFLKRSERVALTVPHRTLVVARHQKEHYAGRGYENVVYIPNGVNLPERLPAQLIASQYSLRGGDYLLSLGRLTPEKRLDWLIEAYREVAPAGVRLVVAGGSSATDDYVARLHRMAGADPNIIFTGYVTGQLKEELLSNALEFVIPSVLEGLPIALLEAMSYGLPCLASDIPPHREVITHGVNGYLFAADSKADLVRLLRHILTAPVEELSAVGEAAREHVRVEYDWERVVDQVEGVYRSLVA